MGVYSWIFGCVVMNMGVFILIVFNSAIDIKWCELTSQEEGKVPFASYYSIRTYMQNIIRILSLSSLLCSQDDNKEIYTIMILTSAIIRVRNPNVHKSTPLICTITCSFHRHIQCNATLFQ